MEEVRKKCEALKRRPRRKFLLLVVRVCGPLVTQRIFFSANGVLFLNVSEYANVCSSHERRYSSTSKGEYKNLMDLKKTKKKKTHLESNTQTGTKECLRLRKVPGTGAFTSTGREATTSKGDVREKCARARVCVSVCTTTPCE